MYLLWCEVHALFIGVVEAAFVSGKRRSSVPGSELKSRAAYPAAIWREARAMGYTLYALVTLTVSVAFLVLCSASTVTSRYLWLATPLRYNRGPRSRRRPGLSQLIVNSTPDRQLYSRPSTLVRTVNSMSSPHKPGYTILPIHSPPPPSPPAYRATIPDANESESEGSRTGASPTPRATPGERPSCFLNFEAPVRLELSPTAVLVVIVLAMTVLGVVYMYTYGPNA
ncbi:unnamed protein product [Peniophora sp. CBMAI 1063]|nr:unnamed protein product [Peniophora sp. CBMAI 1063]